MVTPGFARYLVVSLTAFASTTIACCPWGWFEGS